MEFHFQWNFIIPLTQIDSYSHSVYKNIGVKSSKREYFLRFLDLKYIAKYSLFEKFILIFLYTE